MYLVLLNLQKKLVSGFCNHPGPQLNVYSKRADHTIYLLNNITGAAIAWWLDNCILVTAATECVFTSVRLSAQIWFNVWEKV